MDEQNRPLSDFCGFTDWPRTQAAIEASERATVADATVPDAEVSQAGHLDRAELSGPGQLFTDEHVDEERPSMLRALAEESGGRMVEVSPGHFYVSKLV